MSESKPTLANSSLWGALWKIEIEASDPPEFDEANVKHTLERHFGPSNDNYEGMLNMLRHQVIFQYGAKNEHSARKAVADLSSLNLICRIAPQSSDLYEKYLPFLAPPGAFVSPPIVLRVTGGTGGNSAETVSRLISRLCMILPSSAVKSVLEDCRFGPPAEFEVYYHEHADGLRQRLEELGYAVDISRATDDDLD
jgi:hypothetical protein